MKILLSSYFRNPNIGLFGIATEDFCLVPKGAPKPLIEKISEVLGVRVVCSNIAGTELIGALCIGSGRRLIVPPIAFESEIDLLRAAGLLVDIFQTEQTALGNNIVMGNGIAIMGHNYTDNELHQLSKILKAKVYKRSLLKLNTLGSLVSVSSKGGIVHPDINDMELAALKRLFGVKLLRATVNQGNPYVSIGVLANSKGIVVGELSRGAELTDIQEGFGIVKGLPKNG